MNSGQPERSYGAGCCKRVLENIGIDRQILVILGDFGVWKGGDFRPIFPNFLGFFGLLW